MEKAKKPYKNHVFKVVIQKCEKKTKKNGLLAKIAWHYLCQEGRKTHFCAHYLFLPKIFGPKTV